MFKLIILAPLALFACGCSTSPNVSDVDRNVPWCATYVWTDAATGERFLCHNGPHGYSATPLRDAAKK